MLTGKDTFQILRKTANVVNVSAQTPQPMENNKPRRRSSRRIRGLAPQMDVPPPKEVYLPPELKVAVLAQLDKRDLKNVRLVSKEWNALAIGPLFDKVYVSCRAKDLEVFKNITSHPVISKGVKELVYDGSLFEKDMRFRDYFRHVYYQIRWIEWRDTLFDSADVQINGFVQHCRERTKGFPELYKTHKRNTFLIEGHQKYRDCSAFEDRFMNEGLLLDDLCTGLRSLEHLRSVVLDTKMWHHHLHEDKYLGTVNPDTLHGPSSGSPLCRSWNPFHFRPSAWNLLPEVDDGRSHICAQFHILTKAMAVTNRKISSLQVSTAEGGVGLPQQAWMKSKLTYSEFWHFMTAYSGLRCLEIDITMDNPDQRDALTVLPELLGQTFGLRRLSLHLKSYLPAGVSGYRYDEIFPALGFWPKLTELSISGLAISGWYLMSFLLGRAQLTQLNLCAIDLLDGTWEGVIEGMRHRRQLTELNMSGNFKHCGGAVFRSCIPEDEFTDWRILLAIESYVIFGGRRHPCLPPESDPDTANQWFLDLIPPQELGNMKLLAREAGLEIDNSFWNRN